jgi:hypothetical protein
MPPGDIPSNRRRRPNDRKVEVISDSKIKSRDFFTLTEKFSQGVLRTEEGSSGDRREFQEGDIILEISLKKIGIASFALLLY